VAAGLSLHNELKMLVEAAGSSIAKRS